jgi:hypothetical protein
LYLRYWRNTTRISTASSNKEEGVYKHATYFVSIFAVEPPKIRMLMTTTTSVVVLISFALGVSMSIDNANAIAPLAEQILERRIQG